MFWKLDENLGIQVYIIKMVLAHKNETNKYSILGSLLAEREKGEPWISVRYKNEVELIAWIFHFIGFKSSEILNYIFRLSS